MSKVHARGPGEKIVIILNKVGQLVSDDQSIITKLSNFLGTLVKDKVTLIPKQLKN